MRAALVETSAPTDRARRVSIALIAVGWAILLGGCGEGSSGVGNPDSDLTLEQATAPLQDAPAELKSLRAEANTLLGGDVEALNARLSKLRGMPVVINVWASWCGPCRHEFPFFQAQAAERGAEVAFVGVDTQDSNDAALTFLDELPLPYPSYSDPDSEIARELDVGPGLPNTIFIDREGKVAYHLRGPVTSEEQLARNIDRYAK